MKTTTMTAICGAMIATAFATPGIQAAPGKAAAEAPLNAAAQQLEARYAAQLEALQAEISKTVPGVDGQKKTAYDKAREAEKAAKAALDATQGRAGALQTAEALVGHAKGKWIGGADKEIAEAQAQLAKAATDAEPKAAQEKLAKAQESRQAGLAALEERQAALDKAKRERPEVEKQMREAEQALEQAVVRTLKAVEDMGLNFASSDAPLPPSKDGAPTPPQ